MSEKVPRIAINGFGRIGRLVLRALLENEKENPSRKVEVVAINDIAKLEMNAHLFEFDSIHGRFPDKVKVDLDKRDIIVNGHVIHNLMVRDPAELPWKDLNVDYVIESTGLFRNREGMEKHLKAGAKKVILSAPAKSAKDVDITVVRGVNNDQLTKDHKLISNASCTTNCLAPVLKVLDDNFGVESGLMTTVHSYTNDQRALDMQHSDFRRARAAGLSLIPTTTGAAKAIGLVLPQLAGKVDGMSIRVPTPNVSLIDLTAILKNELSQEQLEQAYRNVADKPNKLQGILDYEWRSLVSHDFNHTKYSAVVDFPSSSVFNKNMVKVLAWYDNEWAFSNRVSELVFDLWKLE